jgi:hypothetical protein
MKLFFIRMFLKDGGDGFTDEQKAYIDQSFTAVKGTLEGKVTEQAKKALTEEMPNQLKALNDFMAEMRTKNTERTDWEVKSQEAIDKLLTEMKEVGKKGAPNHAEAKSFQQVFAEEMVKKEHVDGIKSVSKNRPYVMEIPGHVILKNNFEAIKTVDPIERKTVGDMTLGNLTGDSVATYRQAPAILPSQKINFRELLNTVYSPTGLYISYSETGSEGSISIQTEGSEKSEIDYDMTEIKTVNKYIAGFARFTKQMARSLPFMQNTLPRQLIRDFYKQENKYFYDTMVSGSVTAGVSSNTVHIKKLVDWIGQQHQANYNASYVLVSHIAMAELLNELITNGNYLGAGSVVGLPNGAITIGGVPVIPASWVRSNDVALIYDMDFVERVEVEGLRVEFFEQDYKNVTENKITARIECYEELNRMIAASVLVGDFGDTSTS